MESIRMGHNLTATIDRRRYERLNCAFPSDPTGQRRAEQLCEMLGEELGMPAYPRIWAECDTWVLVFVPPALKARAEALTRAFLAGLQAGGVG
jgi:hypothetical protein